MAKWTWNSRTARFAATLSTTGVADRLNSLPKHGVSSTLEDPAWNNSTVLAGDLVEGVLDLKRRYRRDILVTASARIVQTLLEQDLVDELRLKVFPVVLGAGDRLFGEMNVTKAMRLSDAHCIDGDTAYLTYVRRG